MHRLVAVTGATGFIGRVLIRQLVKSGWSVRALTRKKQPEIHGLQWIEGDLSHKPALLELINGATHIIHCAATVRGSSYKQFAQINIEGTKNLIDAASEKNQKSRFLLISSLAAREPNLSWYSKSKFQSERILINHSGDRQWTILRPTAVYGPGDKELKPVFLSMYRGILPVVGKTNNRFGLIHVYDLVDVIELWLTHQFSGIFEIDDGTPDGYSYQDLADLAQKKWKRPVRCITIPESLIRTLAFLNLQLARLFHYSPMLTPAKVNELQHCDWVCDNTLLRQALPLWQPRIKLEDVLTETIKS